MIDEKTTAVLEKYDVRVLRLLKGRGAVLCETETGIKILKEYKGSCQRLQLQDRLLKEIRKEGYLYTEQLIYTRDNEPAVKEEDGTVYYLKEYFTGKECNIKEQKDCIQAMGCLGKLHRSMELKEMAQEGEFLVYDPVLEGEKQNRELRKIRKYLKQKKQKTDFEYYLLSNFDPFMEKAEQVLQGMKEEGVVNPEEVRQQGTFCHGDVQHHNLLFQEGKGYFINFERFILDSPVRDLTLLFRKIMEKNNWSAQLGNQALEAYEKIRALSEIEKRQLYYRLNYPEKFRKIANFYYNSTKSWIPDKNREKLEKILVQEIERVRYLENNL